MRRKDWRYRSSTERRYEEKLRSAGRMLAKIVKRMKSVDAIIDRFLKLSNTPEWVEYAQSEALQMVKSVAVENAKSWREAASKGQRSREIHLLLKSEMAGNQEFKQIVRNNADLITRMPADIAQRMTSYAAREAVAGRRPEAILKSLQEMAPDISETRARLIARTEVAKAQSTITKVRSTAIGIDHYIWQTSQDQRVRSSHKHMQGVICSFSTPPSPEILDGKSSQGRYGPGEIYNCRCYAAPIVDPEFETWPGKIVRGDQIVRITEKEFETLQ